MLILNGHNLHVTLEVAKISMELSLDIVFLPSHTSHALQPLDLACFKSFKTAFRKLRDVWSLTNKNRPMENQTFCEWTSKALNLALTPSNIQSGFKRIGIWPLNCKAAKASMTPSARFEEGRIGAMGDGIIGPANGGTQISTGWLDGED